MGEVLESGVVGQSVMWVDEVKVVQGGGVMNLSLGVGNKFLGVVLDSSPGPLVLESGLVSDTVMWVNKVEVVQGGVVSQTVMWVNEVEVLESSGVMNLSLGVGNKFLGVFLDSRPGPLVLESGRVSNTVQWVDEVEVNESDWGNWGNWSNWCNWSWWCDWHDLEVSVSVSHFSKIIKLIISFNKKKP